MVGGIFVNQCAHIEREKVNNKTGPRPSANTPRSSSVSQASESIGVSGSSSSTLFCPVCVFSSASPSSLLNSPPSLFSGFELS
ncbi:hypothetical protein SDJN02_07472, partial [Cucurbita argyrosperma subsp. argyrosperma]